MHELKNKIDKLWCEIASVLDDESTSGSDAHNIMLTINARYFNSIKRNGYRKEKEIIKKEYLELINEKLG